MTINIKHNIGDIVYVPSSAFGNEWARWDTNKSSLVSSFPIKAEIISITLDCEMSQDLYPGMTKYLYDSSIDLSEGLCDVFTHVGSNFYIKQQRRISEQTQHTLYYGIHFLSPSIFVTHEEKQFGSFDFPVYNKVSANEIFDSPEEFFEDKNVDKTDVEITK